MSKRMAAVGVGAVAVVGGAFAVVLPMLDGRPGGPSAAVVFDGLTAASFGVAGAVLTWARPRNAIGWVLLVIALCEGLADGGTSWALAADADDEWRTGAAWLASWVWFPALGLMPTVVIALYPTGLARSRMRRLLVATAAVAVAAVTAGFALVEDAVDDIVPGLDNPVAVQPLGTGLAVFGGLLLVPCVLLTLVDAGRRLWRSTSPEREQLAWLLTTVVLAVVISASPWHTVRAAVYVLIPVAIAVGVVRHRLLDLQIVVRRTLLFAGLTAVVVGVFVASTTLVSDVVGAGPLPVAVAAALVAVGLTPVRDRLQRAVDRLIYGDRHDPVRAVASLGRHVAEHDEGRLVDQVLATIAAAVRSPHVVLLDPTATCAPTPGRPRPVIRCDCR